MKNSSRLSRLQKVGLVSAGVVSGAVLAATGFAAAADNNSTTPAPTASSSSQSQDTAPNVGGGQGMDGDHGMGNRTAETEVTGAKADEIKAAAIAKVPGATVDRVETDADGAAYEAHITTTDGAHQVVTFDKDLKVVEVKDMGKGGPGGPGGHRGPGGQRPDETPVTGADADALSSAALAEVPGATVDRVETDGDGAAYEVHLTTKDGAHKTVKFDADKKVTGVEDGMGAGGPQGDHGPMGGHHGHDGHGGPGDNDGDGPGATPSA